MPPLHRLLRRSAPLATVLAVGALLPASALAGNSPLLSGYASPGSGEQTILGGGVVGGGNDDNNSGAGGTSQSLAVTTTTSGSASSADAGTSSGRSSSGSGDALKSTPDRKKSSSPTSSSTGSSSSTGTSTSTSTSQTSSTTTPTPARPGAPAVVAYRNSSGRVGSFPLTAGDVLIALFGLLAIVLAALGLRMVMGGDGGDGPPISQVAVR
jgi:hypothetical protein